MSLAEPISMARS